MFSRIIVLGAFAFGAAGFASPAAFEAPQNARLVKLIQQYPKYSEQILHKTAVAKPVVVPAKTIHQQIREVHREIQVRNNLSHERPARTHGIIAFLYKMAQKFGLKPATVEAIERHESGVYSSPLWINGNNPGGIEYRHFKTVQCTGRRGRWATFATPEDGILAHLEVLSSPRYARAWQAENPEVQIDRIMSAGYCEPGYNWAPQVKKHLRQVLRDQATD